MIVKISRCIITSLQLGQLHELRFIISELTKHCLQSLINIHRKKDTCKSSIPAKIICHPTSLSTPPPKKIITTKSKQQNTRKQNKQKQNETKTKKRLIFIRYYYLVMVSVFICSTMFEDESGNKKPLDLSFYVFGVKHHITRYALNQLTCMYLGRY